MKQIPSKTTYLEMRTPPAAELPSLADVRLQIQRLPPPSVEYYRFLYNSVGGPYMWVDRNLWPDHKLRELLQDPQVEIYLLQIDGQPAGYAEMDRRTPGQVELAYFGLFPQFVGRGLGEYFLRWAVRQAWAGNPQRVWVHTCDLDHPAALPTYLKAGFQIYDEKIIQQVVPDARSP
jgi:GNAT superfamily N-acetyltransferase